MDAPSVLREIFSVRRTIGAVTQSVALAVVDRGDVNTSYLTRAIGTLMAVLLFLLGSVLAASPPYSVFLLLVPIIRIENVLQLFSRLFRRLLWAHRLTPRLLYHNEVFPLQAAAMIWNDCQPIIPASSREDESTIFLDWSRTQLNLWRPTSWDSNIIRLLKYPVYVVFRLIMNSFGTVESVLFRAWRFLFLAGEVNRVPVQINGERPTVIGHTPLLSDHQLRWIQREFMRSNDLPENREALRVTIRATHGANLLTHFGFTRLHEHGPGDHAMSQYYAALNGQTVVKKLLSLYDQLEICPKLHNGNKTVRGEPIPRQVLWARLVVGSYRGLRGEGQWRQPIAVALFSMAQENVARLGDGTSRTALLRHAYTVTRRWFVDWMMYIWWDVEIAVDMVDEPDTLFERLQQLLTRNMIHNTMSLSHAIGELAISEDKQDDVSTMLALSLGENWEVWFEQSAVASGQMLRDAMVESGTWKCVGRQALPAISVESSLYETKSLQEVMSDNEQGDAAEQARAKLASRIVETLSTRLRQFWEQQPSRNIESLDVLNPGNY